MTAAAIAAVVVAIGVACAAWVWAWRTAAAARREHEALRRDRELIAPIEDALARVDGKLGELARARAGADAALAEQVRALGVAQVAIHKETAGLVRALRTPDVRGRWGELQLRRVVELAGMLERCDFDQQLTLDGDDGVARPDLVVHLPGGRSIAVDAKVPLLAYLGAHEAEDDDTRARLLVDHARQVRAHVTALAARAYWKRLAPAPELVVLFLPGEGIYQAALAADPSLLEAGLAAKVLLATPTTLIALLRAAAAGWRQEAVARSAEELAEAGRVLHDRLRGFVGQLGAMRRGLEAAVGAYNGATGAFGARVLPAVRRLEGLGAAGEEPLDAPSLVERVPRAVDAVTDVVTGPNG